MNRYLCVLIALLAIACNKSKDLPVNNDQPSGDGYTTYLIKKGNHYSENNDHRSVRISTLRFTALFDSSCIYSTVNSVNMGDINKLYGFSDCNAAHHQSSARFGWRWNGKSIEISAYCYVNGERMSKPLGTIALSKAAEMSISVAGDQYIFELNGKQESMPRACSGAYAEGYQLYPYFGGDEVAPHDVRILIKEIQNR